MSYSYQRVERRQTSGRTYLGYWLPLAVTATVATVGIAAWIWSERRDNEDSDYDYDRDDGRAASNGRDDRAPPPHAGAGPPRGPFPPGSDVREAEDATGGVMARMSGAIRRTPSPQQLLDGASKKVAAGVAAAGAVVGGALSSIREESGSREDYVDHSRWSEEAETRKVSGRAPVDSGSRRDVTATSPGSTGFQAVDTAFSGPSHNKTGSTQYQSTVRRKTVAIVVSAEVDSHGNGSDDDHHHQDASILSHLPAHVDPATARLFVLIYSPELKQNPLSSSSPNLPTDSITSSFSNIGHDEARGEEDEKKLSSGAESAKTSGLWTGTTSAFTALYAQAKSLVEKETMVLPFTTASGHVHMLRHLAPEIVYIQESLAGDNGEVVTHISGWVGEVIVVVGAEGGHGGLVDSDDDQGQAAEQGDKWWQHGDRVGLGKGVDVVESMRVGEHWGRRLGGKE